MQEWVSLIILTCSVSAVWPFNLFIRRILSNQKSICLVGQYHSLVGCFIDFLVKLENIILGLLSPVKIYNRSQLLHRFIKSVSTHLIDHLASAYRSKKPTFSCIYVRKSFAKCWSFKFIVLIKLTVSLAFSIVFFSS